MYQSAEMPQVSGTLARLLSVTSERIEAAESTEKSSGFDYVILGRAEQKHSLSSYSILGSTTTSQFTITIDTRIIDVATGKIILIVSGAGTADYSLSAKMKQAEISRRYQEAMNEAVTSASSMTAEKICAALTGEYPEVRRVITSKSSRGGKKNSKPKSTVSINRGSSSGVNVGTAYRIYASSGRVKTDIAVAVVKEVRENSCIAEIKGGAVRNIREGDRAEQITLEEAERVLKANKFMEKRPLDI